MGKCLRCGKEIDLIFKNNEEAFYCKECSMKILQNGIETKQTGDNIRRKTICGTYFFAPGIHQIKNGNIFRGISYIFSIIIIPIFWALFLYALYTLNILVDKIKIMALIISFFILLNIVFVIITNIIEVIKEE